MDWKAEHQMTLKEQYLARLADLGLGLTRNTVGLSAYTPQWEVAFLWVKDLLLSQIGPSYSIHHIGSTSIPQMDAKPIIDVLIAVPTLDDFSILIPKISALGFTYKGDMVSKVNGLEPDVGQHFFSYYDLEQVKDYVHIHAILEGHLAIKKQLRFRDVLRADACLAKEYKELKRRFEHVARSEYRQAKTEFVAKVLRVGERNS